MVSFTISSTLPDPLLFVANCFAKWIRIKILMVMTILWTLINLGMSGWLSMSSAGDLDTVKFSDGTQYTNWQSMVCDASPYVYMRPFSFTYTYSNGATTSLETTCGYASTNSIIRYTIGCVGVVALVALFFSTPLSLIARQIFLVISFLYFTVFILDCNDTSIGSAACSSTFQNTNLHDEITSKGITLHCESSNFAGLAVIDLMLAVGFLLLHSSWGMCKDLYVQKK